MHEIEQQIAEARDHAVPRWTRGREDAALAATQRRLRMRAPRRYAALAIVSTLACASAGLFVWSRSNDDARNVAAVAPSVTAPAPLRATDGSTSTPLDATTRMSTRTSPGAIDVTLDAGGARFEVTPDQARVFRVQAGDVTVTVLGTIFTVERRDTDVRVAVERGRVRVAWPGGDALLVAGESGLFPPPPSAPSAAAPSPAIPTAKTTASAPDRDETAELFRAADAARLAGKPNDAEAALRRVMTQHAGDPRAPLAAFTLGRLYLDSLGRPRDAAQSFATARRGGGTLAEDALAREVEAWARAGERETAHARALEYAKLFPSSPRLAAVKKLGGASDDER